MLIYQVLLSFFIITYDYLLLIFSFNDSALICIIYYLYLLKFKCFLLFLLMIISLLLNFLELSKSLEICLFYFFVATELEIRGLPATCKNYRCFRTVTILNILKSSKCLQVFGHGVGDRRCFVSPA